MTNDIENGTKRVGFQLRMKGRPADYPLPMREMLLELRNMRFISNSGDEDWQGMFKGQAPKAWLLELIKTIPAELHAGLEISFGGWPLEELRAPNTARAELWAKLDVHLRDSRLSQRLINALLNANITYVGDIVSRSQEDFVNWRVQGLGKLSREELEHYLTERQLVPGMDTLGWEWPLSETRPRIGYVMPTP